MDCVEMAADRIVRQFSEFVRTIDSKFEKYDAEGACAALADRLPASSTAVLTGSVVSRMAVDDRRLCRVCAKQARWGCLAAATASMYGVRRPMNL